MKHYIILLAALVLSAANATAQTKRSARILNRQVAVENIKATRADNQFFVGMDFCLDELNMPANRRVVPDADYRVGRQQRGSAAHRHQRNQAEGDVRTPRQP